MCANKQKERWLFTDWGFGMSNFKIYDSYETFNLITKRQISNGEYTNWFNIDNVKQEIENYQKNHPEIKIKGVKETMQSIKSAGFSYSNSNKDKSQLDADTRNKNYNHNNQFSTKIKLID